MDLFDTNLKSNSEFVLFHDESSCDISKFLYHGYLFVNKFSLKEILSELIEIKKLDERDKREIHFHELNQHSNSLNGKKTKVALDWIRNSRMYLEKGKIKFYCFGVDKNNVKNFWTNENTFEKNIYLRFFSIGLKSSIRWFRINKISHTYLDNGRFDEERKKGIYWLNKNFFKSNFSNEIEIKNIAVISSNEEESGSEYSNLIQLTDILLGVVRSSFIELGVSQKGQSQLVFEYSDIIERFNKQESAYNVNGEYYKKYCYQFFPSNSSLTKNEFLNLSIENVLKRGGFYHERDTFKEANAKKISIIYFNIPNIEKLILNYK